MKKTIDSSKNSGILGQMSSAVSFSYEFVTQKLLSDTASNDIKSEVDFIMETRFPDEENKENKCKSPGKSKNLKKKKNKTTSENSPLKETDKSLKTELPKKTENKNLKISNEDDGEFTVYLGKNINSVNERTANLIIKLQNSLKKINAKSALIRRYETINYFFRFFECMQWLLLKNNSSKALIKDVRSLRKFFIHQLPFFSTKPTIVDEFISLCLTIFQKELTFGNFRNSISTQLNEMITNLVTSKSYRELLALNTEPLKKPVAEKTEIITPQVVILEILKVLTDLSLISSEVEKSKSHSNSTLHAITMLLCHYWELVNRFYEYQSKSSFTKSARDFPKYKNCLELLSSHEKSTRKNELTQFAKSFRDHRFAHIGSRMLDANGELQTEIEDAAIYTVVLENRTINGKLEFNSKLFIENATLAGNYANSLQEIIADLAEDDSVRPNMNP